MGQACTRNGWSGTMNRVRVVPCRRARLRCSVATVLAGEAAGAGRGGRVGKRASDVSLLKLVIVEAVPAGVCEQCGEQYFTARVAKALEELAHSEEAVQRTTVVPVKVFRARASTA